MDLTFRKLILLIALTVMACASLVYALNPRFKAENFIQTPSKAENLAQSPSESINYEPNPKNLVQLPSDAKNSEGSASGPVKFQPPSMVPLACLGDLLVFAYSAGAFVQASVTLTGPNSSYIGTTTTDPQNPLIFTYVLPGNYSVYGTYNGSTQNGTISVIPEGHDYLVLNFGASPVPPLGHIVVIAWYQPPSGTAQIVQASVTITGPESHTQMSTSYPYVPLIFTVMPGEYSVSGTWNSLSQAETVSVVGGCDRAVFLVFGGSLFSPP